MSAITRIRKYIILAVSGAAIIGTGTFLLLHSYFEKVEIIVAKDDIVAGHELKESDLEYIQYYKSSLPEGFMDNMDIIIGKKIICERKAGDPITESVFEQTGSVKIIDKIEKGEVLIALDISYSEPLIDELEAGNCISIVSTEKEKMQNYSQDKDSVLVEDKIGCFDKDPGNIFYFSSPDVVIIDEQIVIKDLEIVDIKIPKTENENLLTGSKKNPYLFIKCTIDEAPVISRITKDDDYKIFLEKK